MARTGRHHQLRGWVEGASTQVRTLLIGEQWITPCAPIGHTQIQMASIGRSYQPQHRLRLNDQCDIHRELSGALKKLFGAIQWVNHPAHCPVTPANQLLQRRLLGENRDIGRQRLQGLRDQPMRRVIGLSDGAGI